MIQRQQRMALDREPAARRPDRERSARPRSIPPPGTGHTAHRQGDRDSLRRPSTCGAIGALPGRRAGRASRRHARRRGCRSGTARRRQDRRPTASSTRSLNAPANPCSAQNSTSAGRAGGRSPARHRRGNSRSARPIASADRRRHRRGCRRAGRGSAARAPRRCRASRSTTAPSWRMPSMRALISASRSVMAASTAGDQLPASAARASRPAFAADRACRSRCIVGHHRAGMRGRAQAARPRGSRPTAATGSGSSSRLAQRQHQRHLVGEPQRRVLRLGRGSRGCARRGSAGRARARPACRRSG